MNRNSALALIAAAIFISAALCLDRSSAQLFDPSDFSTDGVATPSPVSVSVGTNPTGLGFNVDSTNYNSTQTFSWDIGSSHSLSTSSPQGTGETRFVWDSWSDGGTQAHTVIATTPATYTANFTTRYLLTMCCYTQFGTVSPPTGFYDAGQTVEISATGNGWPFERWVGSGTGSYSGPNNPATVVMNGPIRQDAVFNVPPTPAPTPTPGQTPMPTRAPTPTQTLWVNTQADVQDKLSGDGFCLDEAGECSLRAAITEANAFRGATVIILPAGIYTQTLAGDPEDDNLSGDWDIRSRIIILGAGSASTILQASNSPDTASDRVLDLLAGGVVDLSGVTVRNGKHLFVSMPDAGGGGIAVEGADSGLTLNDVVVENNISEGSGGGIRVGTRGAYLTMSNCAIRNNRAGSDVPGSTATGGGLDIDSAGGTAFPATHRFTDVSVTGNIVNTPVADAFGGGISATAQSTGVLCTGCNISENQAISTTGGSLQGVAGGLYVANTYFECRHCRLIGNHASHLAGAARVLPINGLGSLEIFYSTISGNSAPNAGGVMGGGLAFGGSTISGNIASDSNAGVGGGIYILNGPGYPATFYVLSSTVSGNRAVRGGGIYNAGPNVSVSISTSTIASNTATASGGGLFEDVATSGSTLLKSTIVADNEAPLGPDLFGGFTSEDYNHIENIAGGTISLMPHDVAGLDPQLGELGFHGGETQTHVPRPNSPVLDQIPLFTNNCHNVPPNTDQRGFPRLTGVRCDKGSVEFRPGDQLQNTLFDYDGDGRSDVSVFRLGDAKWYLLRSIDGLAVVNFGLASDKITPADFDGDGKTDVAVYRPATGTWYWLNSSNGSFNATQFGTAEDLPTPADYDGDGRADISVFRPSDGVWYRLNSSDGSFYAAQFGVSEDKPTVGDFDGDGLTDIAVWRPSAGVWYRLNSSDGQFVAVAFGLPDDLITPADFDGDGKTDVAVYRPSNGTWYWLNSSGGGFNAAQFGVAEDIPSAADFDGDGKADICVFRPSDGVWYRLNSSNGAFVAVQFGVNGDTPTEAAFRY